MKTKTILITLVIAVISCNSNKPVKVAKVDTMVADSHGTIRLDTTKTIYNSDGYLTKVDTTNFITEHSQIPNVIIKPKSYYFAYVDSMKVYSTFKEVFIGKKHYRFTNDVNLDIGEMGKLDIYQ